MQKFLLEKSYKKSPFFIIFDFILGCVGLGSENSDDCEREPQAEALGRAESPTRTPRPYMHAS